MAKYMLIKISPNEPAQSVKHTFYDDADTLSVELFLKCLRETLYSGHNVDDVDRWLKEAVIVHDHKNHTIGMTKPGVVCPYIFFKI